MNENERLEIQAFMELFAPELQQLNLGEPLLVTRADYKHRLNALLDEGNGEAVEKLLREYFDRFEPEYYEDIKGAAEGPPLAEACRQLLLSAWQHFLDSNKYAGERPFTTAEMQTTNGKESFHVTAAANFDGHGLRLFIAEEIPSIRRRDVMLLLSYMHQHKLPYMAYTVGTNTARLTGVQYAVNVQAYNVAELTEYQLQTALEGLCNHYESLHPLVMRVVNGEDPIDVYNQFWEMDFGLEF